MGPLLVISKLGKIYLEAKGFVDNELRSFLYPESLYLYREDSYFLNLHNISTIETFQR